MRYTNVIFSVFLAVAFSFSGVAQNVASTAKAEPPAVELPKGDHAWAVRVVRSGGLDGDSFQDITIKSTGQLTIDMGQGKREITISPDALKMLGPLVQSSKFPKRILPSYDPAGCYDCSSTAITVRRREPKGKDRTYSAAWVPTTVGTVSEDFVSIVRQVLGLSN